MYQLCYVLVNDVVFNEKKFYVNMNTMPLVSVICISMNHEKFIERAFNSLVSQTFKDFEILYLDNNSADNSFEIADKIFKNSGLPYTGFKRTESNILSTNVNYLLGSVKGKYIAALSGDDFWELNNLAEKMDYYLQHPEYGMIYGAGYNYYYDTGKAVLMKKAHRKSGWVFKDLLAGNFINGIGFVMKKTTLDDVGLFDEKSLIEDWEMWLRIAEKYPIGYLDKPLVYHGQRTGSNTSANTAYMDKGEEYIYNKYAHHKEIESAKKKRRLFHVYKAASAKPTLKNFLFILKNFQFNFIYFKQVFKFFMLLVGLKKQT
ncbi:MAG: glycosyltransferase [Ferruginibacter sp.]